MFGGSGVGEVHENGDCAIGAIPVFVRMIILLWFRPMRFRWLPGSVGHLFR